MDQTTLEVETNNQQNEVPTENTVSWKRAFLIRGAILFVLIAICWIVVIYDKVAPDSVDLQYDGIIPRTEKGLLGIIFSPLIHVGFEHVATNTLGILVLGTILMLNSLLTFFAVTAFVWPVAGFLTWCVAQSGVSIIGASCLVFGWFGYLIITPFFARPFSFKALGLAVLAGVIYGGLIFGVFPKDPRISWVANICGLVSGLLASVLYWFVYMRLLRPKFAKADLNNPNETEGLLTTPQQDPSTTYQTNRNTSGIESGSSSYAAGSSSNTFLTQESSYANRSAFQNLPQKQDPPHNPSWLKTQPPPPLNPGQEPSWLTPNPQPTAPPPARNNQQQQQQPPAENPFAYMNTSTQNKNNQDDIFNPFAPIDK